MFIRRKTGKPPNKESPSGDTIQSSLTRPHSLSPSLSLSLPPSLAHPTPHLSSVHPPTHHWWVMVIVFNNPTPSHHAKEGEGGREREGEEERERVSEKVRGRERGSEYQKLFWMYNFVTFWPKVWNKKNSLQVWNFFDTARNKKRFFFLHRSSASVTVIYFGLDGHQEKSRKRIQVNSENSSLHGYFFITFKCLAGRSLGH